MSENWRVRELTELQEFVDKSASNLKLLNKPDELTDKALLFKALGDETRLKIIGLLWSSDMCMCEITSALQAAPSTINHHLKQLEAGKVISYRREGKFTVYSLNVELVAAYLTE